MKHKIKLRSTKGVTILALTITIIVLIILAGTVLTVVISDKDVIGQAKDAKNQEANLKNSTMSMQSEYMKNESEGLIAEQGKTADNTIRTLRKAQMYNEKTVVKDSYGNLITIPENFWIWDGENVKDGITICDENGNKFVWVPVGDVTIENSEVKKIELNSYEFNNGATTPLNNDPQKTGYIEEDSTDSTKLLKYGNAIPENFKAFIKSANENHGFYIGRVEARGTEVGKNSKSEDTGAGQVSEYENNYVYTNVTQVEASNLCKSMYTGKSFTSDLANRYAYDTALLFCRTFSSESKYGETYPVKDTYAPKGSNSLQWYELEHKCNIYDLYSNYWEWLTQTTYNNSTSPCSCIGGFQKPLAEGETQAIYSRIHNQTTSYKDDVTTFRPILIL